jgi:hypothetical protein
LAGQGRPKPPSPPCHHLGPPGFIACSAKAAHDLVSYLRSKQGTATAAARLVPLLCPSHHGQPSPSCVRRAPLLHHPPDVISPLICGLNHPVKAAMNTIKGRTFVLRRRPLPPPQRSILAYKRRPPLPGPLHTLDHHSFALFPRFHELPPATSLPILPRPLRPTLWCVPCSINHRGRFSMSRSPSLDHSSDRRLDEAPPPSSTRDHHRIISSPGRLAAVHPPVRLGTSSPIIPLASGQPAVIP